MTRPKDNRPAAFRGGRRKPIISQPDGKDGVKRAVRKSLSPMALALAVINVAGCDSLMGRDDTILSLTLNASFLYRGATVTERLPFECRKRYDFSGPYLHTYPLYQSARMPDGSAIVFGLNGLCEYLMSRDGPDIDFEPREGSPSALQVLSKPLAIPPLNVTWLSHGFNPSVVDVYLVNSAQREDVGGYSPLGFTVQSVSRHSGMLELASWRVAPAVWASSWPPILGYCGGTTSTLDFQGPVVDGIVLPRGAYYSPARRPLIVESARPILYEHGKWRAFEGESHIIRLYRKGTVRVRPFFYFGERRLPFQHSGNAQRHEGVTVNVMCPKNFWFF